MHAVCLNIIIILSYSNHIVYLKVNTSHALFVQLSKSLCLFSASFWSPQPHKVQRQCCSRPRSTRYKQNTQCDACCVSCAWPMIVGAQLNVMQFQFLSASSLTIGLAIIALHLYIMIVRPGSSIHAFAIYASCVGESRHIHANQPDMQNPNNFWF